MALLFTDSLIFNCVKRRKTFRIAPFLPSFKNYTTLKIKNIILLVSVICLGFIKSNAHDLWIETKAQGKVDQLQEVKIYYGEYAHNLIEGFDGWYSDVEDFKLVLISPDNEETILECDSADNYFSTNFTPSMEGVYTLAISHSAKDLGGDYVYQFNTSKEVMVGNKSNGINNKPAENEIYVQLDPSNSYKLAKEIKGNIIVKGEKTSNLKVEIVSPEGWVKTLKSNSDGSFQFKTEWKGKYLIEASYTEDTIGKHY